MVISLQLTMGQALAQADVLRGSSGGGSELRNHVSLVLQESRALLRSPSAPHSSLATSADEAEEAEFPSDRAAS